MAEPLGGRGTLAHRPVLLRETIELLAAERGGCFVDCTVGLGGHSEAILETSRDTQVLGIDRDDEALELARERLARFGSRFRAVHADFRDITRVLAMAEVKQPRGILADLGVSSLQLDSVTRGFSFRHDAPLDMRMDAATGVETAAELLGRLSEVEIAQIIVEILTRRPIVADEEEISANARSRSAKLRVCQKLSKPKLTGNPLES